MALNIPDSKLERVVIVGAGFGGLELAQRLKRKNFQLVLLDKNNFHQFQPLFYQVAMAGLEPSSICFPLRKIFQKNDNIYIRPVHVERIKTESKRIVTEGGEIYYDHLIIATGAKSNFFGNEEIERNAFPLKSISEALFLRNHILSDLESSLHVEDYEERQKFIDIVVVGGGPTGVEVAGALAEMKRFIVPKDYRELDKEEIDIYLIQGGEKLLMGMSEKASREALKDLEELGVKVKLNTRVTSFDGTLVKTNVGDEIPAHKMIWAAGITANVPEGISSECTSIGGRIVVDEFNRVKGLKCVYALGDVAINIQDDLPRGHPQLAQVAIQQARNLAKNLSNGLEDEKWKKFAYRDLGSMATIGRNKAVVDLPNWKFSGRLAWLTWLFVHLFALIGTRNKVVVFLNWVWSYITYDQSLRLIIKPFVRKKK